MLFEHLFRNRKQVFGYIWPAGLFVKQGNTAKTVLPRASKAGVRLRLDRRSQGGFYVGPHGYGHAGSVYANQRGFALGA